MRQTDDIQLEDLTIEKMIQFAGGVQKSFHSVDLHSDSLPQISMEFEISGVNLDKLEAGLKSSNFLYLLNFAGSHSHSLFGKYLKRVEKVAEAAKKLRDLLNAGGNDFAHFLDLIAYISLYRARYHLPL